MSKKSSLMSRFKRWRHGRSQNKQLSKRAGSSVFSFRRISKWSKSASRGFFRMRQPLWLKNSAALVRTPDKKVGILSYVNPIYWIVWVARFFWQWLLSRSYLSLGPAVPAIIVGVTFGLLAYTQQTRGSSTRLETYRRLLDTSLSSKDYETAWIASRVVLAEGDSSDAVLFKQGLIEEQRGNMDIATQRMSELVTKSEYAYAAIWLLDKKFQLTDMKDWSEQKHQQFRHLIELSLKKTTGKNLAGLRVMMGAYLTAMGANTDAARYLASIASDLPEYHLQAAQAFRLIGEARLATKHGESAEAFYMNQVVASPSSYENRLEWAKTKVFLGKESEAIELLKDGYRITNDSRLTFAAGEAYAKWAERLIGENKKSTLVFRMQLMRKAVELAPTAPLVTELIANLLIECRDSDSAQIAELKSALLRGVDPKTTHFIQGTIALLKGNMDEATTHLKIAHDGDGNLPGILNNMAMAMLSKEGADLKEALRFSEMANEQLPNHPYLLETRGQIYLRLGRYEDAVRDLEKGLKSPELLPTVVPALAKAYKELGMMDLAAEYEKASARLKK